MNCSCNSSGDSDKRLSNEERIKAAAEEKKETPVLNPEQSMKKMKIVEGFEVKLVAAEPMISSPVTFEFDDKGRIWVVEMRSFQPIMDNLKVPLPMGRVVILEDIDGDGKMDKRTVFLDSLSVPRAIYLDKKGVLLATPPDLWYIENNNDIPGKRILVDSNYTITNNTEGQTNGLYRSLDNWIYSAGFGSSKRYRKINGKWHIEPTMVRGQWGISQDNFGNLFYNHHSTQLVGDYFMPGLVQRNKYQRQVAGYNELIVDSQTVYPIKPTFAVNNPLREGMLTDKMKLEHFTAACGPVIYRGGLFGKDYEQNAFVAEPVGHLIKRNILEDRGYQVIGKQVYDDKEFIASADERFRPVAIKNGPDGALYIADMYRGVIEDSMWVTPYLKEYSVNHGLVDPINTGRIYKVLPKNSKLKPVIVSNDLNELIILLKSDNGWLRDQAQKKLVEWGYEKAVPLLKNILRIKNANPLLLIHSLWTLEGLDALDLNDIDVLLNQPDVDIKKQVINVLCERVNKDDYKNYMEIVDNLLTTEKSDSLLAPNIAYLINRFQSFNYALTKRMHTRLLSFFPDNVFVVDAIINGLNGREEDYKNIFPDSTGLFNVRLKRVLDNRNQRNDRSAERRYAAGHAVFQTYCITCHGNDGEGIKSVAPPLNNSQWINGKKEVPLAIVLNGLQGPLNVNGIKYEKATITGDMPAFKDLLSESEIASVVNFIRHAWNNNATENVNSNHVTIVRYDLLKKEKNTPFTINELIEMYNLKESN